MHPCYLHSNPVPVRVPPTSQEHGDFLGEGPPSPLASSAELSLALPMGQPPEGRSGASMETAGGQGAGTFLAHEAVWQLGPPGGKLRGQAGQGAQAGPARQAGQVGQGGQGKQGGQAGQGPQLPSSRFSGERQGSGGGSNKSGPLVGGGSGTLAGGSSAFAGASGTVSGVSGTLPSVSGTFPAVSSMLPGVSGMLPGVSGTLPNVSGTLPGVSGTLPGASSMAASGSGTLTGISSTLPGTSGTLTGVSSYTLSPFVAASSKQASAEYSLAYAGISRLGSDESAAGLPLLPSDVVEAGPRQEVQALRLGSFRCV